MTLLRFFSGLLLAAVTTACSADAAGRPFGDAGADAASGDAGVNVHDASSDAGGSGDASILCCPQLELLSVGPSETLTLVPGQAYAITLRVRDAGGALYAGARIDYALVGNPVGSTLEALYAFADAEGEVRVFVQAGFSEASFQVRLSLGAWSVYVPVVVSSAVFSSLPVSLQASVGQLVTDASVQAFAGYDCDELLGVPPSASTSLGAGTAAQLTYLVAGTEYAVRAVATDAGGLPVEQCVDGIDPARDSLPPFDFGLVDPPVGP